MIKAAIYFNGDDCFLAWTMPRTANCWGFAIDRKLKRADGTDHSGNVHNRTGFSGDDNPPHSHKPSTEWPFQRYTWTDHGVGAGDTVSYTITPMLMQNGQLRPDPTQSVTTKTVTLSPKAGPTAAFFNRGILLSQFILPKLPDDWDRGDLKKLKNSLAKDDSQLRRFLMGPLGAELNALLRRASDEKWHVYAALYELEDAELVDGLAALGKRAHIVLSNGSKKKKGEDGNKKAAAKLKGKVDLTRRMLWSEGLGHNKFVVFSKGANKPFAVWTGSTNWATTGLCTQLNNGLYVEDAEMADVYLEQYKRLKADKRTGKGGAKMHFGEELMDANDEQKALKDDAWTVWFSRTSDGRDLEALNALINGANDAILFLMFEPGNTGLLQTIQARLSPASEHYKPDLYVHGVVNTLKPPTKGGQDVHVELVGRGDNKPFDLKVIQPEGIKDGLAGWAAEVTREDFLMSKGGQIGHAIIHTKAIVIDPFTKPIVITGSHNFSATASQKNDENFVVIKGNAELAERYCVNIMATYQHYRWRAYLQECERKHTSPWDGLKKTDQWQKADPSVDPELAFWVR